MIGIKRKQINIHAAHSPFIYELADRVIGFNFFFHFIKFFNYYLFLTFLENGSLNEILVSLKACTYMLNKCIFSLFAFSRLMSF